MSKRKAGLCPHIVKDGRIRWAAKPDTFGTCRQGDLTIKYQHLVQVFGPPTINGLDHKSDAEWTIGTPDGVARIYNYKNGRKYWGELGDPAENVTYWQVGGKNKAVLEWVLEALYAS